MEVKGGEVGARWGGRQVNEGGGGKDMNEVGREAGLYDEGKGGEDPILLIEVAR